MDSRKWRNNRQKNMRDDALVMKPGCISSPLSPGLAGEAILCIQYTKTITVSRELWLFGRWRTYPAQDDLSRKSPGNTQILNIMYNYRLEHPLRKKTGKRPDSGRLQPAAVFNALERA